MAVGLILFFVEIVLCYNVCGTKWSCTEHCKSNVLFFSSSSSSYSECFKPFDCVREHFNECKISSSNHMVQRRWQCHQLSRFILSACNFLLSGKYILKTIKLHFFAFSLLHRVSGMKELHYLSVMTTFCSADIGFLIFVHFFSKWGVSNVNRWSNLRGFMRYIAKNLGWKCLRSGYSV